MWYSIVHKFMFLESQAPHLSAPKFYDEHIHPHLQQCPFWFPPVAATPAFRHAFTAAIVFLAPKDKENAVYRAEFDKAWDVVFPPCRLHDGTRAQGCLDCNVPIRTHNAKKRHSEFGRDAPDFLFKAPKSPQNVVAGAVEIKTKTSFFSKDDAVYAVQYGRHLLSTQHFRDHATVCMFAFDCIQFVQVFHGNPVIRTTAPVFLSSSNIGGLNDLYAYLTATPTVHGIRTIAVGG